MVATSVVLVILAFVTLVAGWLGDTSSLIFASIGASVLAGTLLVASVIRGRRMPSLQTAGPALNQRRPGPSAPGAAPAGRPTVPAPQQDSRQQTATGEPHETPGRPFTSAYGSSALVTSSDTESDEEGAEPAEPRLWEETESEYAGAARPALEPDQGPEIPPDRQVPGGPEPGETESGEGPVGLQSLWAASRAREITPGTQSPARGARTSRKATAARKAGSGAAATRATTSGRSSKSSAKATTAKAKAPTAAEARAVRAAKAAKAAEAKAAKAAEAAKARAVRAAKAAKAAEAKAAQAAKAARAKAAKAKTTSRPKSRTSAAKTTAATRGAGWGAVPSKRSFLSPRSGQAEPTIPETETAAPASAEQEEIEQIPRPQAMPESSTPEAETAESGDTGNGDYPPRQIPRL